MTSRNGSATGRYGCATGADLTASRGPPDVVYEVQIPMWDTCVRLPAGHRLRVEIASSAFPKYDVNLGTGGDPSTETTGIPATNRLWHTPARRSRLLLN